MKAGANKQLDYLLINLNEQPQPPNLEVAIAYQEKEALIKQDWTIFGTQEYSRFGPGVKLYFTLLKYLIGLFLILSIASLPSLLVNFKGNGISLYGNSWGQTFMSFSLANQPILQLNNPDANIEQQNKKIRDLSFSHAIIIFDDILCTCIILSFLIYWRLKTQYLVSQMTSKEVLPSYGTLIINIPEDKNIQNEEIIRHFSRFGVVRQMQNIKDYGDFLLELKQFKETVDEYNQQLNEQNKQKTYSKMQKDYLRIKQFYYQMSSHGEFQPFKRIKAFISYEDHQIAQRVYGLYKYKINNMGLDIQGNQIHVQKCHVEPLSIIWENFHLKEHHEIVRCFLFGFIVIAIVIVTLFGIFILSLHANGMMKDKIQKPLSDQTNNADNITFLIAKISKDPKIIRIFCSSLNYKTFRWEYLEICSSYFQQFEEYWAFVCTISLAVMIIITILIKIVFMLAQLRRFRTFPQKKRFMIISIFMTYLISSSLLIILITGQFHFNSTKFSLLQWTNRMFPELQVKNNINLYNQMNRKWYIQIGKLLLANFILTLNICPWIYILQEWALQKIRYLWALNAPTQKIMNQRMLDRQFYWQFYYSIQLNTVYFCLLFSVALPIFYILGCFAMFSIFITSKVIFHSFTKKPQVYDHKLNSFICKSIGFALFLHQISSFYTLRVEQIFPQKAQFISVSGLKIIYSIIGIITIFVIYNCKAIARVIKKKTDKKNQELMMTEEINSSFGTGKSQKNYKKSTKKSAKTKNNNVSYLNSYKMQDNPYYNPINYMLLLIQHSILQHNKQQIDIKVNINLQLLFKKSQSLSLHQPVRNRSFEELQSFRNLSF